MNRKPVPKRRSWSKVHERICHTRSHEHLGPYGLLVIMVVILHVPWDGETEHAELREEDGEAVPLSRLARWTRLTVARVQQGLDEAVSCGTLELGPDGVIVIPKYRKWQENPSTKRVRKLRERERLELEEAERLERDAARAPCTPALPDAPLEDVPNPPPSMGDDVVELKRRHKEFRDALPEGPRRFRVVWLLGTPTEQALGLRREIDWVAEVMFGGDLEPARALVFEVFKWCWRQAYDGKLKEEFLVKSLFGQAFRARLREWADAQQGRGGEDDPVDRSGPVLTFEQLEELSSRASENAKRGRYAV